MSAGHQGRERGPLRPLIQTLAAAVTVTVALLSGCRGDEAAERRRAEARRSAVRRTPLPLRLSCDLRNVPYCERLGRALRGHAPPFAAALERVALPEALTRLADGRLDVALVAGSPGPELAARLAGQGSRPGVTVLGADVVAAVANVTNRSGRVDLEGLRRALRGEIADWRDVKGDELPFVLYTLPAEVDETRHLRAEILQGGPLGVAVRQVEEVGTQLESVRRTPGGLALVALHRLPRGLAVPEGAKVLPVALRLGEPGTLATDRQAAAKGVYPLRLPVVALWRRGDDPVARRLAEVMTTSTALQREAWLGLPPQPDTDRERLRRRWAGERHGEGSPPAPR